jgi:hypothetical protein
MGTQWVIVEGEPWRVVRVRGGGVEVFDVGPVRREGAGEVERTFGGSSLKSRTLTPSPSPPGRGEQDITDGPMGPSHEGIDRVIECLKANGYRGEGVLLGLASWRAGVAGMGAQPEEVRRDVGAMALVLEGELPWAAEEFVAGFVKRDGQMCPSYGRTVDSKGALDRGRGTLTPGPSPGGRGEQSTEGYLGIAVRTEEVSSWLREWEAAGVWIQGIVPWALVRVQSLVKDRLVGADDLVVIGEEEGAVSLVELREGRVAGWEWLPDGGSEEIGRRVVVSALREGFADAEERTGQGAYSTVGLGDAVVEELRQVAGDRVRAVTAPPHGALFAAKILSGRERPWVNWRQGVLADPHPYRAVRSLAIVAAVMSLIAMGMLIVGIRTRAERYEDQAREFSEQQTKLFQATLPGQRVTVGVRRRFESELVRLKAERGDANSGSQLVATPAILERGLAAIPETLRVRIKSIEVDGPQLTLDCEVRSLTESALLVDALTQAGFEVASPRTELVNGIVPLRLSAAWKSDADKTEAQQSGGQP